MSQAQATMEPIAVDVQTLEWWTVREFANRYRVDKSTVGRWIRAGKLKAARLGKEWRIHVREVERVRAEGLPTVEDVGPVDLGDEWNCPQYA